LDALYEAKVGPATKPGLLGLPETGSSTFGSTLGFWELETATGSYFGSVLPGSWKLSQYPFFI